jgi:hypothetical protein
VCTYASAEGLDMLALADLLLGGGGGMIPTSNSSFGCMEIHKPGLDRGGRCC